MLVLIDRQSQVENLGSWTGLDALLFVAVCFLEDPAARYTFKRNGFEA